MNVPKFPTLEDLPEMTSITIPLDDRNDIILKRYPDSGDVSFTVMGPEINSLTRVFCQNGGVPKNMILSNSFDPSIYPAFVENQYIEWKGAIILYNHVGNYKDDEPDMSLSEAEAVIYHGIKEQKILLI